MGGIVRTIFQAAGWLSILLAVAGCSAATGAPVESAAVGGPGSNPMVRSTFGARADSALATLEHSMYAPPGRWTVCVPNECGTVVRDWGADALTYALHLRWSVARDASIVPILAALATTLPRYRACPAAGCRMWSDVPMWDAVAAERDYEVTRAPAALDKARDAFAILARPNPYARGACPQIDYQRPDGGSTQVKTLETDSNFIKAAILLYGATGERRYLGRAAQKYVAVRRYFLDPRNSLYSVYVFDDGSTCRQLPARYYASVNGNMIFNGLRLYAATHEAGYLADAVATAHAVSRLLNDGAGIYADLQADNDIGEPLVEAMYDLAVERGDQVARRWLLVNAAVATPNAGGAYGRFFGGPAPQGPSSAWSINGGLALAIAAGALDPAARVGASIWDDARFVKSFVRAAPATIVFTGRAIALIGTIGDACCEGGHVRLIVDGTETRDNTGIWQNKSPAGRRLPNSSLWSWRWPTSGRHTIGFEPGIPNAKEGGSFIRLDGYEYVP